MPSILVTGGAGFIGSAFVRRLVQVPGYHVINLDLMTYAGNQESLAPVAGRDNYTFVQGNIADQSLVGRLLKQFACRGIVNFAAESHVDRSIGNPQSFVDTNVVGTFRLLESALSYWKTLDPAVQESFRFMHVSTDEVYGSAGVDGKFTEQSAYAPNSPYSASKAASDHFVRAYDHTYGLPTLITNCSNNYGPYQNPEKMIPLMILNALEGLPLPVYGTGENIRDWLYVDDHCSALQLVLERAPAGSMYNIGGDCELSNLSVVTTICRAIDALRGDPTLPSTTELIHFVTDRPGHDLRYAVDFSRLTRDLGWRPATKFTRGIDLTIGWYLQNEAWVRSCGGTRKRLGLRQFASLRAPQTASVGL